MSDPVSIPTGYYNGVLDLYYALISTPDSASAKPTYGTPAVLAKTVNVTITPRYREAQKYASNRRVRNMHLIDGYDVTIAADQVEATVRRAILGRTADAKGVEVIDGDVDQPYMALGFALTKDNGYKTLFWLYKGKFNEIEVGADTQTDAIEYRDVALSGAFDRRIYDNKIAAILDTDAADADATTVSGWFSSVYETPAVVGN